MQIFKKYVSIDLDGRRKLNIKEHISIKKKYKGGKYTMKQLADSYNVSPWAISKIVNNKISTRKNPNWRKYYDKEKHRLSIQKYRDKKRKLHFASGHFIGQKPIMAEEKAIPDILTPQNNFGGDTIDKN